MVESVKDYAIFLLDAEGFIASWNPGAQAIKGYTRDEIVGQHFSVFYPVEDVRAGKCERELEVATEQGRFEDEGWRVRKDGTRFWANVIITALRHPDGRLKGFGKVTRDLTERKRAEDELRESEELLRLLVERVSDYAIFRLDPEGHVVTWNLGAERIKGYQVDEIVGKHFSIFYPDDALKAGKPQEELRHAIAEGRVVDEGWRVRKDGSQFYAHVVITALRDRSGKLRGFAKVTRDVSESEALRRQTERASVFADQEKLALLDTVLNQSPQGIIVCDRAGKFVIQNRAAEKIWGGSASVENLAGWSLYRAFHPDGSPYQPGDWSLARCLERREVVPPEEHHIQRFDGTEGYILGSCASVLGLDGTLLGAAFSFVDITATKKIEKERAELLVREQAARARAELLQGRLEVTLKSIGDAVIATDAQGDVTFLNPVAERLTGWTTDGARGRPLEEVFRIINEYTRKPVDNPVQKVVTEGRTVGLANHTILISRTGVEASIADSAAPIRDQEGSLIGVVLVFRDVTEERKAERAIQESQEELKEADRRKDEFLAMLAHELRNPLAPISTAAHLLRARAGDRAELQRPVEVLTRQIQHMTRLVDDLLEVSRITRGKIRLEMRPVDAATAVKRAVEVSRPLIDAKKHELSLSFPREPAWINADLTRLAQVLGNLLNNAAKYTPERGQISLTVERTDHRVVFRVRDTGIGIDKDKIPGLFRLFAQGDTSLDRSQGGLGIGLTLARGLVELHGGTLEAVSAGPGTGSEFLVGLPALAERPTSSDQADTVASLPKLEARRILVVDDNRDAAETLEDLLTDSGHHVQVVFDGFAALEAARTFQPEIVLLDIGLPKMDGFEVARELRREHGAKLVLVALTGYGQEADRRRAREAGFDQLVVKPFDLNVITDILTRRHGPR
ncbi:MAG: PAS domain S-box protein [Planctomycetota bacterium]